MKLPVDVARRTFHREPLQSDRICRPLIKHFSLKQYYIIEHQPSLVQLTGLQHIAALSNLVANRHMWRQAQLLGTWG